jgi:hypothetical protein
MVATLSDYEVIRTRSHLDMMMRPHLWPHESFLPLTRGPIADPTDAPTAAFGFILRDNPSIVFIGIAGFCPLGAIQYATPADIVADGWIVD